jgi:small subunit ribosomal protein S1
MEENNIVNLPAGQAGSNAEGQENAAATDQPVAEASTATTNAPAATIEQPAVEPGIAQEPIAETVAAHDDFDWSIDKRNVASYSQEEKEKYDKVYENTFVTINDNELIKGIVVGITKTDVVLKVMAWFL